MPAGVVARPRDERVTLVDSSVSVAVALLLGWVAIVLARRARERVQITLGRAGGERTAHGRPRCSGSSASWSARPRRSRSGFWGLLALFAG